MDGPNMDKTIYLMFGYIGSGKSTFARQLAIEIGAVRLNGDELRQKMFNSVEEIRNTRNNPLVFAALDYATEQVLKANLSVVYDVSHNKVEDRTSKEELASQCRARTILVWVQSPLDLARQRTLDRSRRGEAISVPIDIHDSMAQGMQLPLPNEKCIIIDGQQNFQNQFADFRRQLALLKL